jgi:thiol-disulfide isomerase/thioredoxin
MLRASLLSGLLLLLLAASVQADQIKLDHLKTGTQVYSNITVLGYNTTDLYFTHSKGIANVKLRNLEPDLQKKFRYDPKAAAEAEQQQLQDDVKYQGQLAAVVAAQAAASAEAAAAAAKRASSTDLSIDDAISDLSLIGKPAPNIEVEKWLSGEAPVLTNRFVLVDFWSPWSNPCRRAIPQLNDLHKKLGEKLEMVALTTAPESEVQGMSEPKIDFDSAIDTKARLQSAIGFTSIPTVLLIDPNGLVVYQGHPAALNEKILSGIVGKPDE